MGMVMSRDPGCKLWSCHVILAANFKNFYFSPNSILKLSMRYQIWGELAQEQKSYI